MSSKQDSERNGSLAQRAANLAMLTGAVAGVQQTTAVAQDATAEDANEIIVTGSRIRRLDGETANPVQIVTAAAIKESGVANIGELIQKLPSIGGAATNPSVNNGGGDGASTVELRGLGAERTLVLLNGRRYGAVGNTSSAVDINSIPINMIERVEVLKQGAGAIYGSDAIGGVVNFITKTSMEGAEISVDYGESGESDGERKGVSLSWGANSDTGNLVLGFNYNQQEAISAGDRAFSRNAIYFYGSVFEGGSSRVPTGRVFFDTQTAIDAGLDTTFAPCAGSTGVTRSAGTAGASLADFRCFVGSGPGNDTFNYQPFNLILTPQERASVFALGSHKISEDVEMYGEFLYNRTTSGFQIAPLPFDSRSDNTVISADNIYNPFGIDFGGQAVDLAGDVINPNATFRLQALGNRRNEVETWQGQITGGLKGSLFDTGWNWDANIGYGRIDQDRKNSGYLFKTGFQNALGPSFLALDGTPTCGTPAAPIAGCVPVNIFNLNDPAQLAGLATITGASTDSYEFSLKTAALAIDGKIFDLPAGAVQLAAGLQFGDQSAQFDTDFLTQSAGPLYKDCLLSSETCSGDSDGSYDTKEIYAEVLVPILKDAPFAQSLNLTLGVRYSDYSTTGGTTNGTFKVDWKPIDDLLVRVSYADIYRTPTVYDIYQAPTADAATFTDPCVGLTSAAIIDNPNLALACVNVDPDTDFQQANAQVDGLLLGNNFLVGAAPFEPEEGQALTFGFVYEPQFAKGLSLSVDYWDYSIDNVITQVDVNTTAQLCVASGSPQFCGYINRFGDGSILQILEPTINLGSRDTSGVDFGVAYALADTGFGDFRFGIDGTYTDKYDSTVAGIPVIEVAGTYDRQYGNLAEWRTAANVGWEFQNFTAQAIFRHISSIRLTDPDGAPGTQPDLKIPHQNYIDLTLGYTLESTDTRFQLGVNNLGNNSPPILFQNNVTNANTDVETYDTIGRFFFGAITQKF